jgi:FtsH-binding integral membrane protein
MVALRTGFLSAAICFPAASVHAGYAGYDGGCGGIFVVGLFVLVVWGIISLLGWLKKKIVAWAKKQK